MNKKDNNKSSEEIIDAMWKNAECGHEILGEIKFRKNKKKNYLKLILKVVSFILIASLSGGITAQYVIYKEGAAKKSSGSLESAGLENNNVGGIYDNSISNVVQKVSPSIVGISNKKEDLGYTAEGSGSGIIFKSDGYIITNYHVVEGETEIKVKLSNDNVLKAEVILKDSRTDLAIIKVKANNLPIAKFGDSSQVKVGDSAIVIGNPLGNEFSGTVTAGIISAVDRKINRTDKKSGEQTYKVIQTDAAINPGSIGGALCNIYGEVVGINGSKMTSDSDISEARFAINSNEAQDIINDFLSYGKVIRPSIGIQGKPAISVANDGVAGVYVQEVIKGSGAAKAGIMPTDIITELGGNSIKNMGELSGILEEYKVHEGISCKIWRNGKIKDISIVLSEFKAN